MTHCNGGSWGEARGGRPPPPLSLNQTEARKEENIYFFDPPSSPYRLDPPLHC